MITKNEAVATLNTLSIQADDCFVHYKTQETYQVITLAIGEETQEPMVVYRGGDGTVWVRAYAIFTEFVLLNGVNVPRFSKLDKTGVKR